MNAPEFCVGGYHPNPFADWDPGYASVDANRVLATREGQLIGFHVTTPEAAEAILQNGPKASQEIVIGFGTRTAPPGFWLNCVPFLPYSIETTFAGVFGLADMRVLRFEVPLPITESLHIEPTWPWVQWPVPQAVIDQADPPVLVAPHAFWTYRSQEAAPDLRRYLQESLDEALIPEGGYAAALLEVQP